MTLLYGKNAALVETMADAADAARRLGESLAAGEGSDQDDARRLAIELTDEGRHVTDLISQRIRPELQRRLDRVGAERVKAMVETLDALLQD